MVPLEGDGVPSPFRARGARAGLGSVPCPVAGGPCRSRSVSCRARAGCPARFVPGVHGRAPGAHNGTTEGPRTTRPVGSVPGVHGQERSGPRTSAVCPGCTDPARIRRSAGTPRGLCAWGARRGRSLHPVHEIGQGGTRGPAPGPWTGAAAAGRRRDRAGRAGRARHRAEGGGAPWPGARNAKPEISLPWTPWIRPSPRRLRWPPPGRPRLWRRPRRPRGRLAARP